jgi:hypothetical protein
MSPILPLKNHPNWRHFGKRYLRSEDFAHLCEVVGLHICKDYELEEYEREQWMFPVARMIMPDDYARAFWSYFHQPDSEIEFDDQYLPFHELDWAIRYNVQTDGTQANRELRHPIDIAWGNVDGLERPVEGEYKPWDTFAISLEIAGREGRYQTATHLYHYWQIYELYQVRKQQKGMYRDNVLLPELGPTLNDPLALSALFDAVSYFQHPYQLQRSLVFQGHRADEDGWISLDETQQDDLKQVAQRYATDSVQMYGLDQDALYTGLRRMMELHASYEEADRVRLAEALKTDLWRTVEFMHFAFGIPTEEIAEQAGMIGGYVRNYLELLFPNRRQETRSKSLRILRNLAQGYNAQASHYAMSDEDLENLLAYTESSNLAWFEYVVAELNRAHFELHSWHATETFLHLKALASFPESLMRTLVLRNADVTTQTSFQEQHNPGMGNLNCLVFGNLRPSILRHYNAANHWNAQESAEFVRNLSHLVTVASAATGEEAYLGANLALATLLRNFTSHLVIEDPALLRGQYVRCVRAILAAVFSAWKVVGRKGWI